MKKISEMAITALKAVGLAMGVATAVLVALNEIATSSALMLLSIGVAALALSLFINKKV